MGKLTDLTKSSANTKAKLGSGARFKALSGKLENKGATNPDALAAWIGNKKWGKDRMHKMAMEGRKK